MVSVDEVENFIIGNHLFLKSEYSLKYRFLLVNSMLFITFSLAFAVGVVRFITESYFIAAVDLSISAIIFGLFLVLRQKKSAFDFVSIAAITLIFIFFTVVVVLLKEESSKLIWYPLLIVASYLVKGPKGGIGVFFISSLTFLTLYFLPFVDLYLDTRDVIMTIAAYSCFALFMTFSELQQEKNIKSIQESADEILKQQKMLYIQSRTDKQTQLPNKVVLQEDINNSPDDISCMVLDIDHFDIVAHEFGEEFTDQLLIQVANVLKSLTSTNVSLYHIHGSKFALLINQPEYNQDILLSRTIKSLFENVLISSKEIEVSVSFSIAIVREKLKTLAHASMTIREMRKNSKSDYQVYRHDPKKEKIQKNNLYWAKRLGELMREDKIIVYYQPIIDNFSQKIVKYECLVRAIDGDKIVPPSFFLSVAKSKGILKYITQIVIDKSFQTFTHNDYDFSINITEQDLNEKYLVDFLISKTKQYNIDPKRVFLEVLENINQESSSNSNTQFEQLRELGFGIAIDDFGVEASNLSRLLTLKADIIKIDGQFIKNLDSDPDSIKIVETIVSLAKKMDVKTVAEFVHNEEIYNIVKELGVDFSQGYYFSQPLPQVSKEPAKRVSA